MKSTLRKIGNSRGVLLPASFLAACGIERDIELHLDGQRIVIEPIRAPRSGWFDGYRADSDEDAWSGIVDSAGEVEDWRW